MAVSPRTPEKAVILAAGIGSRLSPLTDSMPKTCVKVNQVSILESQLKALERAGIPEVVVVGGYRIERLKREIDSLRRSGGMRVRLLNNVNFENSNNLASLMFAVEEWRNTETLVLNGDVFYGDAQMIVRFIEAASNQPFSAMGASFQVFDEESMKFCQEQGFVNQLSKTVPVEKSDGVGSDLYWFSKNDTKIIEQFATNLHLTGDKNQWVEFALDSLARTGELQLVAREVGNQWVEIDNSDDLARAEELSRGVPDLRDFQNLILDLDGTLVLGDSQLPWSQDLISFCRNSGKSISLFSNNSSFSPEGLAKKLRGMGIQIEASEIILSSTVAGDFLKSAGVTRCYILGNSEMKTHLSEFGVEHSVNNPTAVLIGYDTSLTYQKLREVSKIIASGIPYYSTHPDLAFPDVDGPIPDCGAISKMLASTTGREPDVTFGKPSKEAVNFLKNNRDGGHGPTLLIGDRLSTDIAMASELGFPSCLVLSGSTGIFELQDTQWEPRYVLRGLTPLATNIINT